MTIRAADGVDLAGAYLLPEGEPRGVVQIMHGMNEYLGRYGDLARALRAAGWGVIGHDARGHGRTAGAATEVLHLADAGGWDAAVGDVLATARHARALAAGGPVVWLGHSLGSFLVRDAAVRFPSIPDALVVLGTSGPPHGLQPLGRVVGRVGAAVFGPERPARLINAVNSGRLRRGDRRAWLTRDVARRRRTGADPWGGKTPSHAFFADTVAGMAAVARQEAIDGVRADLPVLVASGQDDRLGQGGQGPRWFAQALRAAGVRDVTLWIRPGARHELHQEIDREKFAADLITWLDEHAPDSGRGPDIPR